MACSILALAVKQLDDVLALSLGTLAILPASFTLEVASMMLDAAPEVVKARLEKLGEHAMVSYDKFAQSYSMHADVRAAAVTSSSKQGLSQTETRSGFGLFAQTRLCQHL